MFHKTPALVVTAWGFLPRRWGWIYGESNGCLLTGSLINADIGACFLSDLNYGAQEGESAVLKAF